MLLGEEVSISYREGSKMYPSIGGGVRAMDTKLLHLSQVTIQTGLPESVRGNQGEIRSITPTPSAPYEGKGTGVRSARAI